MRDVLSLVVPVFALSLDKILHHFERRRWEAERRRLTVAALAPTPAQAHAAVIERRPSEPKEPKPRVLGL